MIGRSRTKSDPVELSVAHAARPDKPYHPQDQTQSYHILELDHPSI